MSWDAAKRGELARRQRRRGAPAGAAGSPGGLANQHLELAFIGAEELESMAER
jgi:hypothetical protein